MAFNVKQKQEQRRNPGVAYIQYLEINVFGNQYKLNKYRGYNYNFTINGLKRFAPFTDSVNGINVYGSGKNIIFSTQFGLKITWNGKHRAEVYLCDAYANWTCGLCGNSDGFKTFLFVYNLY